MPRHSRTPRRVPRSVWVVVGLVAVVALVAVPLGGWRTVDRADAVTEHLQPGEVHVSDQYRAAVERAEVTARRPGSSFDPEPGTAYLAVYVELEARTDRTDEAWTSLLQVDGAGELDPPSTQLVRDGSSPELQPGLPDEVAYVWEVDDSVVVPGTEVTVRLVDRTAFDSLVSSGTTWIDPRIGAEVPLVVAAGPEPDPEDVP